MNDKSQEATAAAKLAGYTCIAEHAAALTHQHKRLILPASATAYSYAGKDDPSYTWTSFTFEDGSELRAALSFNGNRIDAYWGNEGCKPHDETPSVVSST